MRSRGADRRGHDDTQELDVFVPEPSPRVPHDRGPLWTLPVSLVAGWAAAGVGLFVFGGRLDEMIAFGLVMSAIMVVNNVVD